MYYLSLMFIIKVTRQSKRDYPDNEVKPHYLGCQPIIYILRLSGFNTL